MTETQFIDSRVIETAVSSTYNSNMLSNGSAPVL